MHAKLMVDHVYIHLLEAANHDKIGLDEPCFIRLGFVLANDGKTRTESVAEILETCHGLP